MGSTRTTTQTKANTKVKSSVANSTRGGSSMPSNKGSIFGGDDKDGSDDDEDGDDKKKKKKKDHHSSSDYSDSDEKSKKKKRKTSKKKKTKKARKSLSRDRKVKKKTGRFWGGPDDGKHPWDKREDEDPSRIPGPSYIPEAVRIEMLTHLRSYYNEGLLTGVEDIPSFIGFFDEHG
eukprot:5725216-Amphidinium_carterae.1